MSAFSSHGMQKSCMPDHTELQTGYAETDTEWCYRIAYIDEPMLYKRSGEAHEWFPEASGIDSPVPSAVCFNSSFLLISRSPWAHFRLQL